MDEELRERILTAPDEKAFQRQPPDRDGMT